ncbi:hypothetical protein OE88DRAFT_1649083 [Heliocybe sulcata]|uniref:Uncharacterized protein n=1 Tax=Heliocybe sulcata TaxID=5364 RepID=A0A5C3MM27_9AGAM|nr:hypothetical protein OE88DRAFT_1649083 [Heliocybe sulcata]
MFCNTSIGWDCHFARCSATSSCEMDRVGMAALMIRGDAASTMTITRSTSRCTANLLATGGETEGQTYNEYMDSGIGDLPSTYLSTLAPSTASGTEARKDSKSRSTGRAGWTPPEPHGAISIRKDDFRIWTNRYTTVMSPTPYKKHRGVHENTNREILHLPPILHQLRGPHQQAANTTLHGPHLLQVSLTHRIMLQHYLSSAISEARNGCHSPGSTSQEVSVTKDLHELVLGRQLPGTGNRSLNGCSVTVRRRIAWDRAQEPDNEVLGGALVASMTEGANRSRINSEPDSASIGQVAGATGTDRA